MGDATCCTASCNLGLIEVGLEAGFHHVKRRGDRCCGHSPEALQVSIWRS